VMASQLDDLILEAKALAKKPDIEAAIQLADRLVPQYPAEMKPWMLRGYLRGWPTFTHFVKVGTTMPAALFPFSNPRRRLS